MKTYKQLNFEQRYTIEMMLKAGNSKNAICLSLEVSESTLYRELKRNIRKHIYNAKYAQMLANERKKEGHYKHKFTYQMQRFINEKLINEQWSPEQIKGYCDLKNIDMVSHERIYQYVWQDKSEGGTLHNQLRNSAKKYKKRYGKNDKRGQIPNRISIEERPEIVDLKQRVGDWEADLIIGKNHQGAVLTIVERKTGYSLMAVTDGKKAADVKKKMINTLAPFKELVHTITNDNGKEFAEHQKVAKKLQADVYFAHPYSSWERGLNEYTNKLIRQYLPKSISLKDVKSQKIYMIQEKLNNRPRKKLGYKTPNQVFFSNFDNRLALAS